MIAQPAANMTMPETRTTKKSSDRHVARLTANTGKLVQVPRSPEVS